MLNNSVATLALLIAVLVLAIAPWAQIPAPLYRMLPLSVGAPELSAWLLLGGLLATALSVVALRRGTGRRRRAQLSLALSLMATAFPAYVLVQIPGAIRQANAEWQRVFSEPASSVAPVGATATLRPHPFTWREMLTGLQHPRVRVTRGIVMHTAGGEALTVDVYRPESGEVLPALVQLYGGGWRAGEPADNAPVAEALAISGVVVFAIDYRHAPAWTWPAQLDDVLMALRWVSEHGGEHGADVTRMALLGRSAGAQLAMRASQDASAPKIRAVVSLYGPVDLTEGYRVPPRPDPLNVRAIEQQFIGGTPDERPDAYADASPITRAGHPHPPVLIITAGRDHIVEPRFGRLLHDTLSKSGVSMLLHLPWADHAFDFVPFGPSNQVALYYTQRFLARTLR